MGKMREFELKVLHSEQRELGLSWYGDVLRVGKGTAGSMERWYLLTPPEDFYGDSLEDVLQQAKLYFPTIYDLLPEFIER